jgi:hypothetical protein
MYCRYTYTSDQRFRAIHQVLSEDYLLEISTITVNMIAIALTKIIELAQHTEGEKHQYIPSIINLSVPAIFSPSQSEMQFSGHFLQKLL